MLKSKYLSAEINYDGSQLKPLWNYLEHDLLGPSVVAFRGACDVGFDKMIDGEDLKEQSAIRSDKMLHFIFDLPDVNLFSAVLVQRIFASLILDYVVETKNITLRRSGDDLYLQEKKLSISIATSSVNSSLVHFAVNIVSTGAPVPVCSLKDLNIDTDQFAKDMLSRITRELAGVQEATWKVFTV